MKQTQCQRLLPISGVKGKGLSAIVDQEIYEELKHYPWWITKNGYVYTMTGRRGFYLHRIVMCVTEKGKEVDHINGNRLDNTKNNLRICTHQENRRNNKLQTNNKSGYIGVNWNKKLGKWRAEIQHDYKHIHLGLYESKKTAAQAYDKKAKELWGEFAKTNF